MQVELQYGHGDLSLNLPDDWDVHVIRKIEMPVVENPEEAVAKAFNNPVGCNRLEEIARARKRACIVICDITRPVPNGSVLPVLITQLMNGGMEKNQISILIATGLHRPNLGDELREVIGDDWVFENITIDNHYAQNDEDHVEIGITSVGTPVKLDKRLIDADLRIVVGLVEPHFMAGYSGGRKLITPGVAHKDTITYLHSALFMEQPKAANCIIEGNPLHQQQLEVVDMIDGALAVNVVIDEKRRLSFVNFGEIVESHSETVKYLRSYAEIFVPQKFKTVITSSGGYPLDKTYYQTIKGMVGAQEILAPDGDLFIVSEISEGVGTDEFITAQKNLVNLGGDGFIESLQDKKFAAIDEWQTEMQVKPMRIGKVHLYTTGLSDEEHKLTGVEQVTDLEAAIIDSAGDHKNVAVIPEGPYVIPFVEGEGPEFK